MTERAISGHEPPSAGRRSPYQGLVPFAETDAAWFFGREKWREIIADNLRAYRVTVFYGASGVGKSSVLHAGLIRALHEEARMNVAELGAPGLLPVAFSGWTAEEPLAALRRVIANSAAELVPGLSDVLDQRSLPDFLAAWPPRVGGPLLLVLDQLEELFVYRDPRHHRSVEELGAALGARDPAVHFLLSLREDALASLDLFEGSAAGLLDHLLRLEHLDRDAAREAVVEPLRLWNRVASPTDRVEPEKRFVEAVLDQATAGKVSVGGDVAGTTNGGNGARGIEAPYLQLVLMRVWDEERLGRSNVLRLQTLEQLGGADRIVRTHLDHALGELPERDQELAGRTFPYLVTPSGMKVPQHIADLAEYAQVPVERLQPLVDELAGESRILRPTGDGRYEIYHDALSGPVRDWCSRWRERQTRRREHRRVAALASAAAVLTLVAATLVFLTLRAQHAQAVAHSRELAAKAIAQEEEDPQLSLRLAVDAVHAARTAEAEDALRVALSTANLTAVLRERTGARTIAAASPDGKRVIVAAGDRATVWGARCRCPLAVLRGQTSDVLAASFSPSGSRVLTAGDDGTARVWRARGGPSLLVLRGLGGSMESASFSPDGSRIVTVDDYGNVLVFDARTGRRLARIRGYHSSTSFSPDGKLLAAVGDEGEAALFDSNTGKRIRIFEAGSQFVRSIHFSPDGRTILAGSDDGTARIWDARTGKTRVALNGRAGRVNDAEFSADGDRVVTAGDDGAVRIWDRRTGHNLAVMRTQGSPVLSAAFSPDGTLVLAVADDGTARIFDAVSGVPLAVLRVSNHAILSAMFSGGGRSIVTADDDGAAELWMAPPAARVVIPEREPLLNVAFTPDGKLIAMTDEGGSVHFRPTPTWLRESVTRRRASSTEDPTVSPDGKRVLATAFGGSTRVVAVPSGHVIKSLGLTSGGALSPGGAFSPDGKLIATLGDHAFPDLWDVSTGRRRPISGKRITFFAPSPNALAFSPDGKLLATADGEGVTRIWTTRTRRRLRVLHGPLTSLSSVAFSPNGELLVTASLDGTARIWDARDGTSLSVLRGHTDRVVSAVFSPDGSLVATGSDDGTARLWDVASGASLMVFRGSRGDVTRAAFSPDGEFVVTASSDGTARIYGCRVCGTLGELLKRAKVQLSRS